MQESIVNILPISLGMGGSGKTPSKTTAVLVLGKLGTVMVLSAVQGPNTRLQSQRLQLSCNNISNVFFLNVRYSYIVFTMLGTTDIFCNVQDSLVFVSRGSLMSARITAMLQSEDKLPARLIVSLERPRRMLGIRCGLANVAVDIVNDVLAAICFDGTLLSCSISSLSPSKSADHSARASEADMTAVLEQLAELSTTQASLNTREAVRINVSCFVLSLVNRLKKCGGMDLLGARRGVSAGQQGGSLRCQVQRR
jgi:hypothetical protein